MAKKYCNPVYASITYTRPVGIARRIVGNGKVICSGSFNSNQRIYLKIKYRGKYFYYGGLNDNDNIILCDAKNAIPIGNSLAEQIKRRYSQNYDEIIIYQNRPFNSKAIQTHLDYNNAPINNMVVISKTQGDKKMRKHFDFAETFTFTYEAASIRGKCGFKAYNSKGKNIGIVYMTDDKRSPAFGFAELCMLPNYYNTYGEWHRIKSHGGRVDWQVLCERLNKYGKCECYID